MVISLVNSNVWHTTVNTRKWPEVNNVDFLTSKYFRVIFMQTSVRSDSFWHNCKDSAKRNEIEMKSIFDFRFWQITSRPRETENRTYKIELTAQILDLRVGHTIESPSFHGQIYLRLHTGIPMKLTGFVGPLMNF